MSAMVNVGSVSFEVSAADIARAFWDMDSEEGAEFFAELNRIAGVKLCMQMAFVTEEIMNRGDAGDHDAQDGFQTMLSHAVDYCNDSTERRAWHAQREILAMTGAAKARIARKGEQK